jgi:hypothetical protein
LNKDLAGPPKPWYPPSTHSLTSCKTVIAIFTAMRISNWKSIILTVMFILTEGIDMLANNEKRMQGEVILLLLEKQVSIFR